MVFESKAGVTISDMLEQMSTSTFIKLFLHIKYGTSKTKWYPFPEQEKMLAALDSAATEKDAMFWLLKSRQAAGTSMIAARAIKKCMAIPDYKILTMSKSGDQAEKFLADRVIKTLEWLYHYAPEFPWPKYKSTKTRVSFENGASIEAINSALHAGRGDTVDEVILDEAAAGEFRLNLEEIIASVTGGTEHSATGFTVVLSTSEPGTAFNVRSKSYYNEPQPGVYFYFMGRSAIPDHLRTEQWWQKTVAKLSLVRARREYPTTIDDCFVTEEGFVFPQFDKPEGRHVQSRPIDFTHVFGTTYDHGRTKEHPAVIWYWMFDRFNDHLHVFKEHFWFEPQGGVNEICADINEDMFKLRAEGFPKPQRNVADTAITNNDGRQSIRDMIKAKTGIYFNAAHKHNEKQSLDHLVSRINEDRITFDPSCVHSIRQYLELMWDTKTDRYGKAKNLDNDSVDVGRYCDADLRRSYPKKDFRPMPPRYTRANQLWRDKNSIHNQGPKQIDSNDFLSI